ncbi:hypothetical protein [Candidatus Endomicrobiellum trichonymphae]|uniref:hypothetical protein n=1 Tax=Endomicrobium trichonymphae TaxID=1408204 RepID=UPI001E626588|nr:hypothetical protein [Candidatus Endomicrobium trichonymphae]
MRQTSYHIHNTPHVLICMGLLWFGWFGFHAGSALAANGLVAHVFMATVAICRFRFN